MRSNNLLSTYAKSFNWAGFFLPKNIYIKCSSLYDFCRTIDDIADVNEDLNIDVEDVNASISWKEFGSSNIPILSRAVNLPC